MVDVSTRTPPCKRPPLPRLSTGTPGLDDVLGGGLPAHRLYLVQGPPGAGKTTLALRFLLEGVARGESALYVTLSETRSEIEQVADSHGPGATAARSSPSSSTLSAAAAP